MIVKERIFQDACDKNVAAVVIFTNDSKYYYDAEFTQEIPADDMLNLFFKGVVLKTGTTYKAAVSCTEAGVISFGA